MPVISISTLQALNFGYVSGADLAQWANQALLIAEYNQRPYIFQQAVNQAVSEVRSKLYNTYDLTAELVLSPVIAPIAAPVIAGGVITGITPIAPGSGMYAAPAVTAVDTTGSGATIIATTGGSYISSVEVLEPGMRYQQVPDVSFVGGSPVAPATAVASIDACGRVSGIQVTYAGSGYQSAPTVVITGNGIGATAVCLMKYGSITGYQVQAGGANYSANTTLVFSGQYQTLDQREPKLVKLISIFAVRNVLGSLENISEKMHNDFTYADNCLLDIRSGLDNLQLYKASCTIRSDVKTVCDRFRQIG